jgi:hypothetical protein
MKKYLLFTTLLFAGSHFTQAQIPQTVSIGAGYANETWYSLENGDQGTEAAADWDLAFAADGFSSTIRINDGNGISLYSYPNGDISDWTAIDTTNISTWDADIYNSDLSWSVGAFDKNVDPNNALDFGWGTYSTGTHFVTGDSIYIIKLMDGSYRKLSIDVMKNGKFYFKYANIDGTNEIEDSLVKSDFSGKLFGYYSIENETELDHEPVAKDQWDLLFGRYSGLLPYVPPTPGFYNYPVSGILVASNAEVVQIDGVTDVPNYNDWGLVPFTTNISTIGSDWKSFTGSGFSISSDIVYFVKTGAGDIWKVVITGFGGSANGNFEFTKEKISALSTNDYGMSASDVVVYPNPATNNVSLILNNMISNTTTVQIMNIEGQIMFEQVFVGESNFDVKNIPVHAYGTGIYIVNVQSANQVFNQKLIIK